MTDVILPGVRDVRGTLDGDFERVVVACPPHPQHRGHRGDPRLKAVSAALSKRDVACLRFDYGEWDEGYGEREDARNAIRWAAGEFDSVGIFGYSFGGAMAILAAASVEEPVLGVSALAPAAGVGRDLDVAGAVAALECPLQVLYGTRDSTAEWGPIVEAARRRNATIEELAADHFFLGKHDRIAGSVAAFFAEPF
ncbi:dienelactone hydrolase family protein [Halalkalicoccus sp. NIPERK01]|uniref:dienelactone hydrolase family protein n=1 Tax=Halalkalicoccus sp. NIPERK01 TaxID=3053469 RepID=UPI00256F654C|nr:dienelactone hydrolase family protein [Halalkalicoccus sp. NIPERK01]MDL5362677.1 dienelactone hydrolase family protein [Halalkalicoccus sp. NIPERK01]